MQDGGTDLYFEKIGSGPPLVLVHGGPGLDHGPFKPTLERAAAFATVIFYDQRGCGKSPRVAGDSGFSVGGQVKDLEGLRAALGLERMALLGHSLGAYLALAYAIEHEDRLGKLILVCPPPPYTEPEKQIRRWHKLLTPAMRAEIQRIAMSSLSEDERANRILQITLSLYFHNLIALEEFRRRGHRVAGGAIERYGKDSRVRDLRPEMKRLRLPVTLVAGRHDRRTPPEYAEEIKGLLYDARLEILDGSAHFPFLEQPDEFLGILRNEIGGQA